MDTLPEQFASEPPLDGHRDAPLEMSADAFRAAGHALVDRVADFLASLPERPVSPHTTPSAIRARLGDGRLPETGEDPGALLEQAASLLFDNSTFNGHPRFFGYITSSPAPIGILGDMLAAAVNPNVGAWSLSPAATEIERLTIRWVADFIGFPTSCGGLFVSGGNMANMVCFLAARVAYASRTGWDLRAKGIAGGATKLTAYASAETHTWIQKAADLSGLGTDAIRWIEVDSGLRMRTDKLRERIHADRRAGFRPFLVVGTAGSVATGAIDPLPEIAALCREEGVWFHVDGAYGAPAARVPGVPADLTALGEADSVAVDPHKWLYAPLEAACVLVREPAALLAAFSYRPSYYHFHGLAEDPPINFFEWGPQNSRGFRALKVWLAFRQIGRAGHVKLIADDIALARRMFDRVRAHPELEAVTCGLSIATFRYVPANLAESVAATDRDRYLNELNTDLLTRLQEGGAVYLSNAVIGDQFLLRACIVNFRTTGADVDAIPDIVVREGRLLHASKGAR
ncbi:MAG TPA: aminotransferase class V-fold PLP-dependent enzyme [Gemmatimonadaceae bacterium]|nr:aminotransferase class V-fold PLP-dependent enzyme [Gemmatimonadaceae bacterium]